ncbi:hypothetical protein Q5752_000971 [Cryptotrichosporon argae]
MDMNNVESELETLAKQVTSLEPVEYNSAINNYFDWEVSLQDGLLNVHGASNLKKLLALDQTFAVSSDVVGPKPSWDADNQIIKFSFKRQLALPWLPPFLPFKSFIYGLRGSYTASLELHLYAQDEVKAAGDTADKTDTDNGKKYYVTKIVVPSSTSLTVRPFVPGFIWHIASILWTSFMLALATTVAFLHQYPYKQYGFFGTARAIILEVIRAVIFSVHSLLSGGVAQLKKKRESAKDSASDAEFVKYVQHSIQSLHQSIQEQGSKAGELGLRLRHGLFEHDNGGTNSPPTTQDSPQEPQTPLGGTNPLAAGAPSYAKLVAKHPDNNLQWSRT